MQIAIILTAVDNATRVVNNIANASIHALGEVQEKTEKMANSAFKVGRESGELALGAGELLREPMKAFAEMQEASDSLQSSMMTAGGGTSAMFEKVNKLAEDLSTTLPGTTAEFKGMFTTLMQNGVSAQNIMDGTGRSIAEFATVTHTSLSDAAGSISHLKNATGIADGDMEKFVDTLARLNNMGAASGDLENVFAKSSQQLKALGIQGEEATKSVGVLFASFLKQGMSSKMVGGGLSDVLDKLYDTKKVQEFQQKAQGLGLSLEFVDKNTGQFKGIENMVAQFDKIKQAGLDTQNKKDLVSSLFGDGAGANMALGLIDGGIESYNKAQEAMAGQATVGQKAEFIADSVANKWQVAWKKFEIALAGVGAKLLPLIESLIKKFVSIIGSIQNFISKHPTLIAWMGKALAIFAAVAASVSILSFIFGGAMKAVSIFSGGLKGLISIMKISFSVLKTVATQGVRFLGFAYNFATSSVTRLRVAVMLKNTYMKIATVVSKIYAGALNIVKWTSSALAAGQKILTGGLTLSAGGFTGAATATWAWTAALLANPIVWIIALIIALCAVVYLVIKNWTKVKTFFSNMWKGIKKIFSDAWEWIKASIYKYSGMKFIVENWGKIKAWFSNMWESIKQVFSDFWEWLKAAMYKYSGIKFIVEGWGKVKHFFSDMWEKVKGTFTSFFNWVNGIPGRLWQAGKNMVNSLWKGIKDMAMKPVNAIKDIVKKIRSYLPFSPAKEGPLMDIHRIRLVETIADSIKPNAMIEKMKSVASLALQPLQPILNAAGVDISGVGSGSPPISNNRSQTQGGHTLTYSPVIHFAGGLDTKGKDEFSDLLKKHSAEFERMFKNMVEKQSRTTIKKND